MNRTEYEQYLTERAKVSTIKASELTETAHASGLVMYGYDVERNSIYVFVDKDLGIGVFVSDEITRLDTRDRQFFDAKSRAEWKDEWPVEWLRPNKRAYPQFTTLEFARLIRDRYEYELSFASVDWDEED